MSAHRSTALSRIARGLAAASIVTLAVIGATGAADAADPITVTPVTDYSSYPEDLPEGCPDGPDALEGLSFSNGRGGNSWELGSLDVAHGDTVTMSWDAFEEDCLDETGDPAIMVGLAAYDTVLPGFDPDQDQDLTAWSNCGAGADPCDTSAVDEEAQEEMDNQTYASNPKEELVYTLSLTLPTTAPCNVQLDAHLGRPLAVVGPSGSYYSEALRDDNAGDRLVSSAAHFTLEPCEKATTTTPAPTTTPTSAPVTTAAPARAASVTGQVLTRNVSAPVVAAAPAAAPNTLAQVAQQQLPATGRNSVELVRLAAWLCLAGAVLLMVSSAMSRRFLRW